MTTDTLNAFVPGPRCEVAGAPIGPLAGLTFAVKDLIDVAGWPTGGGNPDWERTHPIPQRHAWMVGRLLDAGASVIGKTGTDEISLGILGENPFTGTPLNPAAPDRVPGGSSSGSASAVAGGVCDFALGTDTGGSVRVPASFCGVAGWRPSHGRVPLAGVVPFAPSYDTVGLLARDAALLQGAASVLLECLPDAAGPSRFLLARDAFALADPAAAQALRRAVADWTAVEEIDVFDGDAASFRDAYVTLQGLEIAAALGPFLATRPAFGPTIRPRFDAVRALDPADGERWRAWRSGTAARLRGLLPSGTVLLVPAAPSIAPRRFLRDAAAGAFYDAALTLGSIAGHAGLPAISLPVATLEGCPLGLCLVAGPGDDERLLALAASLPLRVPAAR